MGCGGSERSLGSVYTERLVDETCHPESLLRGGGFETELPDLVLCGNAEVQSEIASEGSRAIRLRTDGPQCNPPTFGIGGTSAKALIPLPDVDFVGQSYTIRFEMRVVASTEETGIDISLTNETRADAIFGGPLLRLHDGVYPIRGFNQYNLIWEASDIVGSLDPDRPAYLEINLDPADSLTEVIVDNVEVVPTGYYPCGAPMEDGFAESARDLTLVAVDIDQDELVVFRGDGQQARSFDVGLTESYRFSPSMWGEDQLLFPLITFSPQLPDSASVVPASGTDLMRLDLRSGNQERVYQTLGSAGSYEAYSYSNVDALDIEVRQSVLDEERGVGILTICGRNRQVFGVTSDDLCLLTMVDAETFDEIESETQGFYPTLSPDTGQVAYYDDSSVWLAPYSKAGVGAGTRLYRSSGIGTMATAAAVSPDGGSVVFADAISTEVLSGDEVLWTQSLYRYDVATGRTRMIRALDFGLYAYGFAWTPDSAYLVYTVLTLDGGAQAWWLNVETGATGPITTDIRVTTLRGG